MPGDYIATKAIYHIISLGISEHEAQCQHYRTAQFIACAWFSNYRRNTKHEFLSKVPKRAMVKIGGSLGL